MVILEKNYFHSMSPFLSHTYLGALTWWLDILYPVALAWGLGMYLGALAWGLDILNPGALDWGLDVDLGVLAWIYTF